MNENMLKVDGKIADDIDCCIWVGEQIKNKRNWLDDNYKRMTFKGLNGEVVPPVKMTKEEIDFCIKCYENRHDKENLKIDYFNIVKED